MKLIKPQLLQPGDGVELITPASQAATDHIQLAVERFRALGFTVKPKQHLFAQDGYFAGSIQENVEAIHQAFADPQIKAIIAVRGGYGCARLLPYLDFELIEQNPKVVMGFSDLTALLNAITHKTGLITFHGPVAGKPLHPVSKQFFDQILCSDAAVTLTNPANIPSHDVIASNDRIHCIHPGKAKGRLFGGNLTVFNTLLASDYCPSDFSDVILFFEDVGEDVYKIDRALNQLALHGVLDQIQGIIFGSFRNTTALMYQSPRLEQMLESVVSDLKIPSFRGALFGHQAQQYILPLGLEVTIDALNGSITFSQSAVSADATNNQQGRLGYKD